MSEEHIGERVVPSVEDRELKHYGILTKSGRYPWGSGKDPYQRSVMFYKLQKELKESGLDDNKIAEYVNKIAADAGRTEAFNTTDLRQVRSLALSERRAGDRAKYMRMRDVKKMSVNAIARQEGVPEPTVRSLLKDSVEARVNATKNVANLLREQVDGESYIQVGAGTSNIIGVSKDRLDTAVAILKDEGYEVRWHRVPQLGTGNLTTVKILLPPGHDFNDVNAHPDRIKVINWATDDNGGTYKKPGPPKSMDSKRLNVVYAEDGGADKDGLIEIRPGADGFDMGKSRYAQVRIAVDGEHYIKGMAVYSDKLPPGVDVQFNTNKKRSDVPNPIDTLKKMKVDPTTGKIDSLLPFGAQIKPNGQRGHLNIVNEEGDWDAWSRKLSSQMLSKQKESLAKQQLTMTSDLKASELAEIQSLTNVEVKKKLLQTFADGADSSAVTLKAMGMPRTNNAVILPVPSIKENEVYAPQYRDGERVVLVRHPHAGPFEIPELIVNNRSRNAKAILGTAPRDAIAINPRTAEILSGADFDGDTVLVIPQKGGAKGITRQKPLAGLEGFDPQSAYPGYEGMKVMSNTQRQMGEVSNLITDMTLKGATDSQLARAVRHSMVVIDAEKHGLNYKQSYADNAIGALKKEFQTRADGKGGASTLISRAKSRVDLPNAKPRAAADGGPIDKKTGQLEFTPTGESYVKKSTGKVVVKTTESKAMAATRDAHTLSSGTIMEGIYADHANTLKGLANEARRDMVNTPSIKKSPTAAKTYAQQVLTLDSQLNLAKQNAPYERQAMIVGNAILDAKRASNPDMDSDELKKARNRALEEARIITGAKKQQIEISPIEWEAIQANAISPSKLREILSHADIDQVKEYATPRPDRGLSSAQESRILALAAGNYTQAEIADAMGLSPSAINRVLKGGS